MDHKQPPARETMRKDGIDGRRRGAVVLKMKSVYHERWRNKEDGSDEWEQSESVHRIRLTQDERRRDDSTKKKTRRRSAGPRITEDTRTRPPVCRFDSGAGCTGIGRTTDDERQTKRDHIGVRCDQDYSTRTQSETEEDEEGTTVLPGI